jgi:predicted acylesterase/phospholipase RssA
MNRPSDSTGTRKDKQHIGPKKKIGFVCSGGATKAGAFHLGVALALREKGFHFKGGLLNDPQNAAPPSPMEISCYVGSSAGSIIAAYLASGYTLENIFNSFAGKTADTEKDRLPKPLQKLSYQVMFRLRSGLAKEQISQLSLVKNIGQALMHGDFEALLQLRWLKTTGIFSTIGLEEFLRDEVLPKDQFQELAAELYVTATELNKAKKVVFGKNAFSAPGYDHACEYRTDIPISKACAASTSLPIVYAPYALKERDGSETHYIDGELRDTLSSHIAADAGCDLIFASYTHQPYSLKNEIGSLTQHGLPAILAQAAYLVIEQKIQQHIYHKNLQRNAILEVEKFAKEAKLDPKVRNSLVQLLERELQHNRHVDTIYIHPSETDSDVFFGEHFSLSPKKLVSIVRSGFRAANETLARYEFADKVERQTVLKSKVQ